MLITTHFLFPSRVKLIQSRSFHTFSLRYFSILFSHLCLGLPSGHHLPCFPTKTQYAFIMRNILNNMYTDMYIYCAIHSTACPCHTYTATTLTTNMNVTRSSIHPVHKSQWMISLEKLYTHLFQQHNTNINKQSQKHENPHFDLTYSTQIKHTRVPSVH